ncbi:MAG: hypothetical protein JNJ83_11200 [Verrucomicrobiaceae bacterium]|nr:hypothetical protein [Verrucomicrobiaceae bacterium]
MSPRGLFLVLLLVGAAAAALIWIKQASTVPIPVPSNQLETSLFPPTPQVTSDRAEVERLEQTVAHLEDQIKALTQENAQLLQKLGSIGMKNQPQPLPEKSAVPPKRAPDDYVALGLAIAKLRDLEPTPRPVVAASEEEARAAAQRWLQKLHGADFGKREGVALHALGLIPEAVDTLEPRALLLARQISGWYDEKSGTQLVIPPHNEPGGTQITTEPALAIAYGTLLSRFGDQLFGESFSTLTSDERQARLALLGGDAALIRFLYGITTPSAIDPKALPPDDPDHPLNQIPSPDFIRQRDLFSLTYGFEFAQTLHSANAWPGLTQAYARPPLTTAEIFDSERYLNETNTAVPASKVEALAMPDDLWDDRLGQFALFYYLKRYMEPEAAHEAASLWRGDRLIVIKGESRASALWKIHAGSADGAKKLHNAVHTAILNHYGLPESTQLPHNGERSLQISVEGEMVTLVDAESQAAAQSLWQR